MKKLVVLLVLLLFLTSCGKTTYNGDTHQEITSGENSMNENSGSYLSPSESQLPDEYVEILSKITNEKNSNAITQTHSEEDFFNNGFFYRLYSPLNGYNPTIIMFEQNFDLKIECLRQLDEENYYCVYKTKEKGFLYCFFRVAYSEMMLYNSCYVKESLKKYDFKNIKLGDHIERVTEVDSALSTIYNHYSELSYSAHLLKDGLLVIEYEDNIIKNIIFNDDFIYSKNGIDYNYKILKNDYPQ